MNKISIIVPIYNSELYIEDCIKSIINQSYKNIEIILINDGSTDNSLNICLEYKEKDNRIVVIDKENSGVSHTRNVGIEHSTGDFISFVDSDDIVDKYYIEYLVKDIENTKFNISKKISFKSNNLPYVNNSKYISKKLNKNDIILLDKMGLLNSPWGKLFSKKILVKYNIKFDNEISLGEDLLFNLEYLKHINMVYVIENKLYYYRHTSSNSLGFKYRHDMEQIQIKLLKSYQNVFDEYKNYYVKIYNDKTINTLNNIIKNEFKNKKNIFFKKIKNVKDFLNKDEIKKYINECKKCSNKIKYYILKYNLVFTYYMILKIRKKI